jgi:uncharacterized membrane protein YraQ (UPF0718 family)
MSLSSVLDRATAPWRLVVAAVAWGATYAVNEWVWEALRTALGLDDRNRIVAAVQFFLYDTVKILLLLVGLMFAVGVLRASLDLERARAYLEGRGLFVGLVLAVVLGVVTPFCSCSSIPLFIGFVAAGIPLSVTLTFLIASPLVSEIAAIMIADQFGLGIAVAYVVAGSVLAIAIGWVFSRFDLDHWVEDMAKVSSVRRRSLPGVRLSLGERTEMAAEETQTLLKEVWPWVLGGVAIGAVIHGWVPTDFFVRYAGPDNPFAVLVATVAGLPLYVNGAGVVPIGEALWSKGMSLGTVMAFMMSAITLSIPQAVMLRKVLKPPLLAAYFGAVTVGIVILGFGFNATGL